MLVWFQQVCLSANALIEGDWKYITGEAKAGGKNSWQNPAWPGGGPLEPAPPCNPCLFNLTADPYERSDLAPLMPAVVQQLEARLHQLRATAFQTGADGYDGGYSHCISNTAFLAAHQGFVGPLCTKPTP